MTLQIYILLAIFFSIIYTLFSWKKIILANPKTKDFLVYIESSLGYKIVIIFLLTIVNTILAPILLITLTFDTIKGGFTK